MTRFQKAVRTSNVTSSNSVVEIIAGSKPVRLWNCYVSVVTAVAGVLGWGRPAAAGVTPTTPAAFPSIDAVISAAVTSEASLAKTALAWGTSPTDPATFYHRVAFPATVGAWAKIQFPYGLLIPVGGTFVLHNILGGPTYDIALDIAE